MRKIKLKTVKTKSGVYKYKYRSIQIDEKIWKEIKLVAKDNGISGKKLLDIIVQEWIEKENL